MGHRTPPEGNIPGPMLAIASFLVEFTGDLATTAPMMITAPKTTRAAMITMLESVDGRGSGKDMKRTRELREGCSSNYITYLSVAELPPTICGVSPRMCPLGRPCIPLPLQPPPICVE
eukprot:NP_001030081.2 H2-GS14-2 antigen [Mus musculus]